MTAPPDVSYRFRLVTIAAAAVFATRSTAAAAAAGAFFTRASDVDRKRAAIEFGAIERFDGFVRFFVAAHGHETETTRTTCFAVRDQVCFGNGAVSGKGILQIIFGGVEGKISYVQFVIHFSVMLF